MILSITKTILNKPTLNVFKVGDRILSITIQCSSTFSCFDLFFFHSSSLFNMARTRNINLQLLTHIYSLKIGLHCSYFHISQFEIAVCFHMHITKHCTTLHSSSKSNQSDVTLLTPCSRACSSVMILRTTTSTMQSANKITNMAKFDPWWWNWKEFGGGPGGGNAATPNITKLDIGIDIVTTFSIVIDTCVQDTRRNSNAREKILSAARTESPAGCTARDCNVSLMKYESF